MILTEMQSGTKGPVLVLYFLVLTFAYFVFSFVYKSFFSPLSKFPGPKLASCSRLWKFKATTSGKQHQIYFDAHKKYGPVFRDGPNSLSFWDPVAMKRIYGIGREAFPLAPMFPTLGQNPEHPAMFSATDVKTHQKARRQVAAAYSMSSILQMEKHIDVMITKWEQGLDRAAESGKPFDLSRWTNFVTHDILTDLAFGQAFGFLERDDDVNGIMKAFQSVSGVFAVMSLIPSVEKILFNTVFQKLFPIPEDQGIGYVKKMAKSITDDRYGKFSDNRDLINAIINSKDADGNPTHRDQVQAEVMSALIAGGDSTASTIIGTIGCLLQTPHAMEKLRTEIDSYDSQGLLSADIPAFSEIQQLNYLEACINESLRLSPAIPMTFERRTPPGPPIEIMKGVKAPGDINVGINNWVMGRHPGLYGIYAETFRPERWSDASEDERKRMKDYEFCFGHGARVCIGKHLAYVELSKCILEMVRKYDLKPLNPNRLWKEDAKLFMYRTDMMVYITKRDTYDL